MKIKSVRLMEASGSPSQPLAALKASGAGVGIIEIASTNGAVGHAPIRQELAAATLGAADAFLLNADGRATAALWKEMHESARRDRYAVLPAECIAALDIALWGLRATARGVPLYREIGAENVGVPAVRHAGAPSSVSAARQVGKQVTSELKADGTFMVSLELSADPDINEAAANAASKSFSGLGGRGVLGVRMTRHQSAKETVREIALLERSADIGYVEVPSHGAPPEMLRIISDGVRAAVSNSPTLATREDFYPFLSQRVLDIVQINPHLSGITGSLELADAAYAFELPVLIAPTADDFGAHLAGAMPYAMGLGLLGEAPHLADGRMAAPEDIGAGWTFASKLESAPGEAT